ncbi:MAG: acyl carrier protein [Vulcanimicrobiota bacterium]
MRSGLFEQIVEVLRGPCGVKSGISVDSRLVEDLELDSVGLLCLAVGLENKYRIKLQEHPEEPPATVADLMALLEEALSSGEAE